MPDQAPGGAGGRRGGSPSSGCGRSGSSWAPSSARRSPSPGASSSGRPARRASSTGGRWRRSRSRASGRRPGALPAAELRGRRARLRPRDGEGRAGPVAAPRHGAARGRRPGRGRGPGRLGAGEHGRVLVAHRPARGRAAGPGAAGGRRVRQGDGHPREPLGHDAPARVPARVHGLARPRPVRPRAAVRRDDARAAPVRRGEHPPDGPQPRRAARPVPDLDRPPRDDPRVRVRGAPVAAAVPRRPARAPALAVQRGRVVARAGRAQGARGRPAGRRPARRPALAGAADVRRAAAAVPRDAGDHEPARGVRRPRHGRGGQGPRARRRADLRPLPRAAPAAHPVRARHAADHRAGPQDGAVP